MELTKSASRENSAVKLDALDLKLLNYLSYNVRIPANRLAKKLSISRQKVSYRLQRLHDLQIISGSRTVLNERKFGYNKYRYFFSLRKPEDFEILKPRFLESPWINFFMTFSGQWRADVSIMAKDPSQAQEIFRELTQDVEVHSFSACTITKLVSIHTLPTIAPEEILTDKNDSSFAKSFSAPKIEHALDKIDMNVLSLLSKDASLTLVEMGAQIGLTHDAVRYRIKKLIQSKYILSFVPDLDSKQLGYDLTVIMLKGHGDFSQFETFLKGHNQVLWASRLLGEWNYMIYILHQHIDEMHSFVEIMKRDFSDFVLDMDTLHGKKRYKYQFMADVVFE